MALRPAADAESRLVFRQLGLIRERPLRKRALHALGKFVVRRADTNRVLTEGEQRHYRALASPPSA